MQHTWPERLSVVRHGESAGNVARVNAESARLERIELDSRDVDVPLSDLGKRQSEALGRALAQLPEDERPTVLWVSPYLRAQQTAEIALAAAGLDIPVVVDERLREREFGVLDGLTRTGIEAQWPQESARRKAIGKFYHRPPGGESWSDALLRVRSAVQDLRHDAAGERVLVVAHQVVVLLLRYVLEQLTEQEIMAIDKQGDVANASFTTYRYDGDRLRLETYNDVRHLEEQQQPVTAEPEGPHGPR
ncbi:MAG: histidine phosphatase family protein [Frankiales bacterium]|jgi:probable phosphoglycerate mutase|nr:histidine phosphatase family protein [Frankiales bacterium]